MCIQQFFYKNTCAHSTLHAQCPGSQFEFKIFNKVLDICVQNLAENLKFKLAYGIILDREKSSPGLFFDNLSIVCFLWISIVCAFCTILTSVKYKCHPFLTGWTFESKGHSLNKQIPNICINKDCWCLCWIWVEKQIDGACGWSFLLLLYCVASQRWFITECI